MTCTVWWDLNGQPHAVDEHGKTVSPFDGVNRTADIDRDARGDIMRVGRIVDAEDGAEEWHDWNFDGRGRRVSGATYTDDGELTHVSGWPLEDLRAIYAEHGEGASVAGRGETLP